MNWVEFQETNFDFGKTKLHEIDAFTFRKMKNVNNTVRKKSKSQIFLIFEKQNYGCWKKSLYFKIHPLLIFKHTFFNDVMIPKKL